MITAGFLVGVAVYIGIASVLFFGWRGVKRGFGRKSLCSILSLIGFGFGTASALLAISGILYAQAIGGFPYYDPRLLRIYRWGFLLSLTGFVFAIGGVWRTSALRWYSPVLALGTLLLWFAYAAGE
jgi:hypothetical protein